MKRKFGAQIGLLLCGGVLGVATAYGIARSIQLKEGHSQLESYSERMVKVGEQIAADTDDAVQSLATSKLPFCSEEDLAFMRDYVYSARHIRDLGRVKDGKLICSTGVGKLKTPRTTQVPDLEVGGMKVYTHVPLMISNSARGFIVEVAGVSVVMNPESFLGLDEPPMSFSGLLYDRAGKRLLPSFGHVMPLTNGEILAGRYVERDGVFYQPRCSTHSMLCVVVSESRAAVLARSRTLFVSFLVSGALLGGALGLILMQLYLGQRSMENRLRRAVQKGLLTMVYQPIVSLETGTIVGAEALVRWEDEDGNHVRPDIFVALAEEHGFVGQITRFVTQRVAEELGDLLAKGKLRVTLNIAAEDLADPGFFHHLKGCLAAAQVNPSNVGLELTERSTADHKTAVHALAQFKNTGHVMYIDDFGTGYSSLAYLHELHVDAIKMDRAFTRTVGTGAVTASVVPQILEMAAQLDLLVVVEGIETREQAEYFRAAGRGILGQGWLFGMPVPASQFRKLLQD